MSCPPEWWIAAYVDDGIGTAENRRVEAHLVGCERCRGHVLALREEARALVALLGDERAAPRHVVHEDAPARGMRWSLPLAVAATALATAAASALIEMRLPSSTGWLGTSALLGVNEMAFDTIFMLRDRAPGWLELATGLAALGGLAAIFTFLAGALVRRYAGAGALLALALVAGVAEPARAATRIERKDIVRIARGETVAGTLVASCESLEIEGSVQGDVLAFCERVAVRGEVLGTLVALGREHELRGSIGGNALVIGEQVGLGGTVAGNAYLGGERVRVESGGRVARDAFLGGQRVRVEGELARDVSAFGERIEVKGEVGRDVETWSERTSVLAGARVGGAVLAHLPEPERLEIADGAVVVGKAEVVEVLTGHRHTMWSRYRDGRFYTWLALGFAASFLIGMLLHWLAPSWFSGRIETGREFFRSLGLGFAFAVLGPLALALIALTIVGIPAALMGLAAWAVCLYLGGIVVAALIGRALVRPRGDGPREFGMALGVGLLAVVLLENLPFVGGPAGWVIALLGVGLLVAHAHGMWRSSRTQLS
jgi:hypothetical protein